MLLPNVMLQILEKHPYYPIHFPIDWTLEPSLDYVFRQVNWEEDLETLKSISLTRLNRFFMPFYDWNAIDFWKRIKENPITESEVALQIISTYLLSYSLYKLIRLIQRYSSYLKKKRFFLIGTEDAEVFYRRALQCYI
jgi:hypothetical protein